MRFRSPVALVVTLPLVLAGCESMPVQGVTAAGGYGGLFVAALINELYEERKEAQERAEKARLEEERQRRRAAALAEREQQQADRRRQEAAARLEIEQQEAERRQREAAAREERERQAAIARVERERREAAARAEREQQEAQKRAELEQQVQNARNAAEHGDAEAQFNLGDMYRFGRGISRDQAKAAHWYRLAAEQGHVKGQFNLGFRYNHGLGVRQDHVEAVRWYRLAAEQGDAEAQYHLGLMYQHGRGVAQDHVDAVRWYRMAAEQGNQNAPVALIQAEQIVNYIKRGEEVARQSGIRWQLKKQKDPLTGEKSLVATHASANTGGARARSTIECGMQRWGFNPERPVPKMTITVTIGSTVTGINLYGESRSEGRIKLNDEVIEGRSWIQGPFSNVFEKQIPPDGNIREDGFFWFKRDRVSEWMVEIPTDRGALIVNAPPLDPAIRQVIQSCKTR